MKDLFERASRLVKSELNSLSDKVEDALSRAEARAKQDPDVRRAYEEIEAAERAARGEAEPAPEPGGDRSRSSRGSSASSSSTSGARSRAQRSRRTQGAAARFPEEVRQAYAALELPLGSDATAVKAKYRELLKRYHPDRHHNDPERHETATLLTQKVREAHDTVQAHLKARQGATRMR